MTALKAAAPKHTQVRTKIPANAEYAKVVRDHALDLQRLTALLGEGRIDPETWADAFHGILVRGHGDAYALGRQRAGDLTPKTQDDARQGLDRADLYGENLQNFLEAIEAKDPRYVDADGALREAQVNVRARQYCASMRVTASQGFVDAGDAGDEYDWELGPVPEANCADCPELAALGPYTASTIISHPGDGGTDCGPSCHCKLVRRRGKVSCFARVDLYGDALPATSPAPKPKEPAPDEGPVVLSTGSRSPGIPIPPRPAT